MGLRVAVASGNWSNTATWNGGVLPGAGDIVASNTYTVTIDQNINVGSITNTAQSVVGMVPNMTSNTTPSGIVNASVGLDQNLTYAAYKAFGGDQNTEWRGGDGDWISYEFTSPKAVDQYLFQSYSNKYSWRFEAWDGGSWIILQDVSGQNVSSYTSPLLGNSTPYIRYRIVFLTGQSGGAYRIHTIQFYEYLTTSAANAGGGFTLNGGVTATMTSTEGILAGSLTCLTCPFNSPEVSTINANVYSSSNSSIRYIIKSGTGTLNFNGTLDGNASGALLVNDNCGTTNVVGYVKKTGSAISIFSILTVGNNNTINITGDITGNVTGGGSTKRTFGCGSNCIVNITGNVDGSPLNSANDFVFSPGSNSIINITGNVTGTSSTTITNCGTIITSNTIYLKIIGQIIGGTGTPAIYSTSNSSIHIFSGPFISHDTGIFPFWVSRMHYFRTMGSYFEFRNNSTDGALPPSLSAPATRLVSPDTVVDAPTPNNVRQGVVYASGSQTGTMIIPSPSNVVVNVPVDNTVGTAALTPESIWNFNMSSISGSNTMGTRLKNTATVQTMGDQIQILLTGNS